MSESSYTMDKPRTVRNWRRYQVIVGAGGVLVLILVLVAIDQLIRPEGDFVDRENYIFAAVKRGPLTITVEGYGQLVPVAERWVTARVGGTVNELIAEPGERLKVGDPIITLINPLIEEELERAQLDEAEAVAQHAVALANIETTTMNHEVRVLQATATLSELQMQLHAKEELAEANAYSQLELESARIRTEQASEVLQHEESLLAKYRELAKLERQANDARLKNTHIALQRANSDFDALTVRSELDGTVKSVLVELGQPISLAFSVAVVIDTSAFKALIAVPERRAAFLTEEQPAVVTVLGLPIDATVSRVNPTVADGQVEIELRFEEELPDAAKPYQSVQAIVTVSELDDVLHVRRPYNVSDNSMKDVFRLNDDGTSAVLTSVHFGIGSFRDVQVVDGLEAGDQIVLGNLERFEDVSILQFK